VPHEWVPIKKAWQRIDAATGQQWELTKRYIKADLVSGRLVGAALIIAPGGIERRILARKFWEPVRIGYAWSVAGWGEHYREGEEWYFFVRRRELDQHYPAQQAPDCLVGKGRDEEQELQAEPQSTPERRKPGRRPKHDWQVPVAFEVGRIVGQEGRQPTAPEMLQWCGNKWDWQPDLRQMQRLLRALLT
jgi:hypothetical protein